jgi:hypothetical protein
VYHCCRRVNPPRGHKEQRGSRPEKHHSDRKPSNKRPEETLPPRGLGRYVCRCIHISE